MQQRQLRLGDILDDYCPRERRITNHAVVAMVGPEVKQTRCTTCDAEHEYKAAKVPAARRKKEAPATLYAQVLAEVDPGAAGPPPADEPAARPAAPPAGRLLPGAPARLAAPADPAPESDEPQPELPVARAVAEDGPVHRALIRATLPRTEATLPTRQIPEFTIRQTDGRPGKFRAGGGHRQRPSGANGQGARHAGRSGPQGRGGHDGGSSQRPWSSQRQPQGARAARPGRHKKRSR